MPAAKPVWAIDVGNNSLKALHIQQNGDKIDVIGLDYIEHSKILSTSGLTEEQKAEIIQASLNVFVSRNELGKDSVAISVPGQTSFARFIKLPPVEPKRVPEIVRFEAVQQIPFDINEVEWDWQLMPKQDSPETEVGIFAIKNELINGYLNNFTAENIRVDLVQMAPVAMYNYAWFDRSDLDDQDRRAVILLDMGAENTNLVICTKSGLWQRCIPLGGNNFTNTIAEAFKLNFEKAEKLKRSAPMSKYARQIFHAMKPVFTDFGAEVQRSLGYYSNSHKGTSFTKIVLLGGGFKLQGLHKYLQQATQLTATRPDSFEKLVPAESVSSAKLHDNIADFGIVYGLGVQAIGQAKVESNLLPARIARSMMWAQKSKIFIAAASVLLVVSLLALFRTNIDLKAYQSQDAQRYRSQTADIVRQAENAERQLSSEESRDSGYDSIISQHKDLFKYRDVLPKLHEVIYGLLPNAENNEAQAELYQAYRQGKIEQIEEFPRNQRKQIFVTSFAAVYSESLESANWQMSGTKAVSKSRTSSSSEGGFGDGMMMPGGGFGGGMDFVPPTSRRSSRSSRSSRKSKSSRDDKLETEEKGQADGPGFVVVIEGYVPYEKIGDLLDPAGVGDDRDKWGLVTKMMNLNAMYKEIYDSNCPFELFKKDQIEHFKLETGLVDIADNQGMPAGIGVEELKVRFVEEQEPETTARTRRSSTKNTASDKVLNEQVLIDPLTKEEISRTFDIDEQGRKKYDSFGKPLYIERDRWFRIKAKFLWKDTTAAEQEQTTASASGRYSR